MIDSHYDILSILYQCYLRMDFSYVDKVKNIFRDNNVSGVIANLYFGNKEEMNVMLGNNYGEIDVVEMFKISTELFKKHFPNTQVIFSIEGCDYINSIEELEELHSLGLGNIMLVWNNPNKYGSGNRGDYGLTDEGRAFINRAIELGISIDFSHMNKKTFYDTYELIKEKIQKGIEVKAIASHSNSFKICPHIRNLDDEQLKCLKEIDAVVGVVSYASFVLSANANKEDLKTKYLEHIDYICSIMGKYNVAIASDDVDFYDYFGFKAYGPNIFDYENIREEISLLMSEKYKENEIENIMYNNIYNKLF